MRMPQFLNRLWSKIKEKAQGQRNARRHYAEDDHKPSTDPPPYRYRTAQHQATARENQHYAAEQEYWQDQLKLAKDLNRLTDTLNWITGWATGFAGLAAVFGFGSLIFLWWTLNETIKNDRIEQRAWVGVVQQQGPTEIVAGVPYTWVFRVRNGGKTPALNVRRMTDFTEGMKGQKFIPVYRRGNPDEPEDKSITVIQPEEGKFIQAGPVTFPQGAIDALRSGAGSLYVHGQIQYDDIFGVTHCTLFCSALGRELPLLTSCAEYNGVTDTKCPNIE